MYICHRVCNVFEACPLSLRGPGERSPVRTWHDPVLETQCSTTESPKAFFAMADALSVHKKIPCYQWKIVGHVPW